MYRDGYAHTHIHVYPYIPPQHTYVYSWAENKLYGSVDVKMNARRPVQTYLCRKRYLHMWQASVCVYVYMHRERYKDVCTYRYVCPLPVVSTACALFCLSSLCLVLLYHVSSIVCDAAASPDMDTEMVGPATDSAGMRQEVCFHQYKSQF